jgi:predicted unusual protein kinase regulating ubiquinone biosynthesis (AarF/ABC1/UbiB family)
LDLQKLVDTLVQCSLKQMLENGFFHLAMSSTEHCRFLD